MFARRSNAAAKRAAEDLTDEADDAKRHKARAGPMAATASSAAAAAAASNSSSAGPAAAAAAAAPPSQGSDSALAAAAAAVPLPDSLDCPICKESFPAAECKEEGGAGRVPRSLPCPKLHTFCTCCLQRMVQRGVDKEGKPRIFVRCSLCQFEHELHPRQPPASSAAAAAAAGAAASEPTDADLVRLIPINASLMDAVGRGRQLERLVLEQQQQLQGRGGARCAYAGCEQPALFWCDECESELCAAHDRDLHPEAAAAAAASSSAAHRRIPLSERAAARQAKLMDRLTAEGAKLRSAFFDFKKNIVNHAANISARLQFEMARHERLVLAPLRSQLRSAQAESATLEVISADIGQLSDAEMKRHEARIRVALRSDWRFTGLLVELSAERRSDLERFLQTAGVSLNRIRGLLYRGSRDGFHKKDFLRMCAGRSGTLTIIKVKDNGYVFGAYTHCSWPAVKGIVGDPSGKSFLFSLVNASGKAARFGLQDKDRAIEVRPGDLLFGANIFDDEQRVYSNFGIMMDGRAADQKDANMANPVGVTLSYQPDDGEVRDESFLAGQPDFAAEEIEVFQL